MELKQVLRVMSSLDNTKTNIRAFFIDFKKSRDVSILSYFRIAKSYRINRISFGYV